MVTWTSRFLAILATTLIASVALSAQKTFDKHFNVAPGGHLIVDADLGSVAVVGRAGHEVVVHGEMSGSDEFLARLSITAEQDSSGVTVTARRAPESWLGWFGLFGLSGERVSFTIDVPRDCSVELKTSGGSLDVRNVNAPVWGRTSGGGIVVRDVAGSVKMHTSGGGIDAEHINGTTELRTSGGSISVADATGDLDVHTSGGGIRLKNIDGGVSAVTSGGSVYAEMRSNRGITLRTSGGGITLSLPESVRASVDARTSGGHVSSALRFTSTEAADRSHLHGEINGGGEEVVLHTSGGSIHLGPLT